MCENIEGDRMKASEIQEIQKKGGVVLFESAKHVLDGDLFRARVDSVEGHRRVILERVE